jgi:hypothetical protein
MMFELFILLFKIIKTNFPENMRDTYSWGIKISGTIFLSLQQNLCKAPSTVIMTDIQILNFFLSVTQSVLNFEISVSCTECN